STNPAATSFKLYGSTDQVNWTWFANPGQGVTSYTWGGGSPSTSYYFYVTASVTAGDSGSSNTATVTTLAVPAAPSNLTATAASATQVTLSLHDTPPTCSTNPAATSFKLYRSTDQSHWTWFVSAGQGVTSYAWGGGSPSTTYYFYVT